MTVEKFWRIFPIVIITTIFIDINICIIFTDDSDTMFIPTTPSTTPITSTVAQTTVTSDKKSDESIEIFC